MATKRCSKCKEIKKLDEFYKKSGSKDGRQGYCKSCKKYDFKYWSIKYYGFDATNQYEFLYHKQNGKCAICGRTESKRLHIDHNHKTGNLRGLLCSRCNRGLGFLGDSVETLKLAIEYLENN